MKSDLNNEYQWIPGAMYPPELDWLKHNIVSAGIDTLIECGRQDGASALWMYENLPNVEIYSIDLDDRPSIAQSSVQRLKHTSVNAISGNIFDVVPQIVRAKRNSKIAIIEDAVKGWPGLCLLSSMIFYPNVRLIAQHNVHIGHFTRDFWLQFSGHRAFLESSEDQNLSAGMENWIRRNKVINSNRSLDHSSLAVSNLEDDRIDKIDFVLQNLKKFGNWNPIDYRKVHGGDTSKFYSNFKRNSIISRVLSKKR